MDNIYFIVFIAFLVLFILKETIEHSIKLKIMIEDILVLKIIVKKLELNEEIIKSKGQ